MKNQRLETTNRLHEICDDLGIPRGRGRQTGLAKIAGVTQQAAGQWLDGDTSPSRENFKKLAAKAKVSLEWLEMNRGHKHLRIDELRPKIRDLVHAAEALPDYKVEQLIKIEPALAEPEHDGGNVKPNSEDGRSKKKRPG